MLEKRCRLMKSFGWSADYVRKKLPGAQGWVYYYWALENEMSIYGSRTERKTPGYIKQEAERIWQQTAS